MPLIIRRQTPGTLGSYPLYKKYLRLDFCHTCVYCSVHECEFGGLQNFGVEHYRPKGQFPKLLLEYSNLLYSCNTCNRFKLNDWPSEYPVADGKGYLNPCEHDFEEHFKLDTTGKIAGLTGVGKYMVERMHINRRFMVDTRYNRLQFEQNYRDEAALYKQVILALQEIINAEETSPVHGDTNLQELIILTAEAMQQSDLKRDRRWQVYEPDDFR